jgi:GntR family transcriptional repressor for pyruvate dehydrogenase complex
VSGGPHEALQRGDDRGRLLGGRVRRDQLQLRAAVGHGAIVAQRLAGGSTTGRQRQLFGTLVHFSAVRAPIPRESVPDHVFDRLRVAILEGRYRPGDRLPSQRALAADLEVNMASVREALGRLEQLRLVEVRHGSATRVLDWRRSGGLESLVLGKAGDEPLLADLFEARRLLLTAAARLAAERRSTEQAGELRALAGAFPATGETGAALLADWAFMATLVEAAGNVVFQLIMNSVRELYLPRAEAFAGLVSDPAELAPHYEAVADAVVAGDPERAADAVGRLAALQESRVTR